MVVIYREHAPVRKGCPSCGLGQETEGGYAFQALQVIVLWCREYKWVDEEMWHGCQ